MRGEQLYHIRVQIWKLGSPPHARGAANADVPQATLYRITPACAGSRIPFFPIFLRNKDHPRMRGEQ